MVKAPEFAGAFFHFYIHFSRWSGTNRQRDCSGLARVFADWGLDKENLHHKGGLSSALIGVCAFGW
jgi:hypothetical protein